MQFYFSLICDKMYNNAWIAQLVERFPEEE